MSEDIAYDLLIRIVEHISVSPRSQGFSSSYTIVTSVAPSTYPSEVNEFDFLG